MSLPTSYLTSVKNLGPILESIKSAQAPERFTVRFLESLDFKSNADRLVSGVLQSIGFLTTDKKPTERYYQFLDQTQSEIVLAEGIREAYADLFQINKSAQSLSKPELVGKIKTLTQGAYSDSVISKMATTFMELCKLADFNTKAAAIPSVEAVKEGSELEERPQLLKPKSNFSLGGLHYNIQLILPESRDPKVYDALFRSLKEHLT